MYTQCKVLANSQNAHTAFNHSKSTWTHLCIKLLLLNEYIYYTKSYALVINTYSTKRRYKYVRLHNEVQGWHSRMTTCHISSTPLYIITLKFHPCLVRSAHVQVQVVWYSLLIHQTVVHYHSLLLKFSAMLLALGHSDYLLDMDFLLLVAWWTFTTLGAVNKKETVRA